MDDIEVVNQQRFLTAIRGDRAELERLREEKLIDELNYASITYIWQERLPVNEQKLLARYAASIKRTKLVAQNRPVRQKLLDELREDADATRAVRFAVNAGEKCNLVYLPRYTVLVTEKSFHPENDELFLTSVGEYQPITLDAQERESILTGLAVEREIAVLTARRDKECSRLRHLFQQQ